MTSSLVGSEMCIRDSSYPGRCRQVPLGRLTAAPQPRPWADFRDKRQLRAVSYTHLTLPTICSV
eukprot:11640066-Prorocentrum_lima.AAC.1